MVFLLCHHGIGQRGGNMQSLVWTEDFGLGNDTFDSQHRQLIDLINITTECLERSGSEAEVLSVLKSLQDYAWNHFNAEEAYMSGITFPEITEHVQQHRIFITRIMDLQSNLFKGDADVVRELSDFLNFWLIDHIVISDYKYASFAGTRTGQVLMT
jgi:hemerythrin-like metal-binding protein